MNAEELGLRARDEAYHLPSFIHLQAAGAATGYRRRSDVKQRERMAKQRAKYGASALNRRGAYK
eukprot:464791-Amphidinium_carterae.1